MRTIRWEEGVIVTVDQSLLPRRLAFIKLKTPRQVVKALREMRIRGAPLIGAAAALALAQTAYRLRGKPKDRVLPELYKTARLVRASRPTAVNLFNALNQVLGEAESLEDGRDFADRVVEVCLKFVEADAEMNRKLSIHGAKLISPKDRILTHCNAGAFATVEYGTALGVIREAHQQGKNISVLATETRPMLQGARLTAFELKRMGVSFKLITDGMVGYVMYRGLVDKVIVGADRILASGHVINKIGTYTIAVLAGRHGIPFYVAAPTTTLDLETPLERVVIEERNPREVLEIQGVRIAPRGVEALNPAFDVTPPELVSGIITEKGVVKPERVRSLA
ncbi:MAG: S-methyl-5-thioribose-1-phosphate isomerase [Candidatus Hecatellales archaeon]|nr:MAG: S-methyl-5-thioribose-1-phosphate isomerase [Candidatus Hecatellales archaeon]